MTPKKTDSRKTKPGKLPYRRVLLKMSGEVLMGEREFGLDSETVKRVANDIKQVVDYEVIFLAIRALEKNDHCICLESSILEVMDAIFSMPIVTEALVSMHKPHVYNGQGTPAISLRLKRAQWAAMRR